MPHDRIALDDRWTVEQGRIVISGTQAIARVLLDRARIDARAGLRTAGYVTGYRGSPLGTVDSVLWSIRDRLDEAQVRFQPGLNEDIAATAVRGTQQIDAFPDPRFDGVFAAWYGKGPGVDRSGDALKHGNYAGAHPHGGVLVFYGDDHAAKSSTVAHHSEQAVAASLIPSLYPSDVEEIWRFGMLGHALSRDSGCWVGIKCVTEIVEQTASIDIDVPGFAPVVPSRSPRAWTRRPAFDPLGEERAVVEDRLPRVAAFVRANGIDRTVFRASAPRVGIVTAGKSFGDVRSAIRLLGLDTEAAGLSLYKIGCIWPLETDGLRAFAQGHDTIFVVEEKSAFLEPQIAAALVNVPAHPRVVGKRDLAGAEMLSSVAPLEPVAVADALRRVLRDAGFALPAPASACGDPVPAAQKRSPYFCSGCPHNRSTRIPDGSLSLTGIGCHTMVNFVRPEQALLPTQMGGEGGNWIGAAPFSGTAHVFQNLGDGTYYHSGLMAIRAAVAAGVNITYKILYNDAVAMTGGQPIDGPISVAAIARQVEAEGVRQIVVLSDDPRRHRGDRTMPAAVTLAHRDRLDAVQRELRQVPGTTVLIYEQTCAAESRRRRKRREMPDPPVRAFIARSVCEGCGDCSDVSTCVSILPVETAFGRKRAIDQSSCNKDLSCTDGFCPSFVTIHGAEPRRVAADELDETAFADLPDPEPPTIGPAGFGVMIAGIGGTGVVTVGAVIGMAAHIDGRAMRVFDMTGVSQKNGAVFSHLRIADAPEDIGSARLAAGEADTLLALDLVAALASESLHSLSPDRTRAIASTDVVPGVDFQFDRDLKSDPERLLAMLGRRVVAGGLDRLDAKTIATATLGDAIGANMLVVGHALQSGLLPVSVSAVEAAIRLNAVAVPFNLKALRLGRLLAVAPDALAGRSQPVAADPIPATLDEIVAHRSRHLLDYQGAALRDRYRALVDRVRAVDGGGHLSLVVARNYARLLAYKDEYEVARLLSSPALRAEIARTFEDGGRIAFNLAPPLLPGKGPAGRPRKRRFSQRILPMLGLLARLRALRGSPFDPFGHSRERRAERRLAIDYAALVEQVLAHVESGRGTPERAVALLDLADAVRGYGPIKAAAMARYRIAVADGLRDFLDAPAPPRIAHDTVPGADPDRTEAAMART